MTFFLRPCYNPETLRIVLLFLQYCCQDALLSSFFTWVNWVSQNIIKSAQETITVKQDSGLSPCVFDFLLSIKLPTNMYMHMDITRTWTCVIHSNTFSFSWKLLKALARYVKFEQPELEGAFQSFWAKETISVIPWV